MEEEEKRVIAPMVHGGRKYASLMGNFFRGNPAGQIDSVYRVRGWWQGKVDDYRAALAAGDCTLGSRITPQAKRKLDVLGIPVPPEVHVGILRGVRE